MAVLEEIEDEPPGRVEAPAAAAPAGADDSDSDDDPPPLESATAQLDALNLRRQVSERVNAARSDSRVSEPSGSATDGASTSGSSGASKASCSGTSATKKAPSPGIKRGFFDAPVRRRARAANAYEPEMVFLKGKKSAVANGAAIPDFMRVELEGSEATAKLKRELLETLKPDKETVDEVMKNENLMRGFDDPEVMAAVEDVARDPKNMAKYAKNPKVVRFYQNMAGMVGKRFERKGDTSTSGK